MGKGGQAGGRSEAREQQAQGVVAAALKPLLVYCWEEQSPPPIKAWHLIILCPVHPVPAIFHQFPRARYGSHNPQAMASGSSLWLWLWPWRQV